MVGTSLGLDDAALDYITMDTKEGHEEKVYQMLLKWKQKNGKAATYQILGEALNKAGRKDLQDNIFQQGKGCHSFS